MMLRQRGLGWLAHMSGLGRRRKNISKAERLPNANTATILPDAASSASQRNLQPFPTPHGTDWAWRPDAWQRLQDVIGISSAEGRTAFGKELSFLHDGEKSEFSVDQIRNTRADYQAPFGLRLDVFDFDGSFLLMALDLPGAGISGMNKTHVIRVETHIEMERPLESFLRLNLSCGTNTEQIVRELPVGTVKQRVEFDLAYSDLDESPITRASIDLILESPSRSHVVFRDFTLSRRRRAEI